MSLLLSSGSRCYIKSFKCELESESTVDETSEVILGVNPPTLYEDRPY